MRKADDGGHRYPSGRENGAVYVLLTTLTVLWC